MADATVTLPDLASPYALGADSIAAYERDGHVLLRGVASRDEVAAYRPVIHECVMRHNKQTLPLDQRDTYHKAFLQIANLWENDAAAAKFVLARRFARLAAELMGVDGVRLYHDQALFKEGGGGPTPWHQDQYYWPLATRHTITMWMPLVDVPIEMGVLTFASGTSGGPLLPLAISDASNAEYERIVRERGLPIAQAPMRAGDATFHSGWTLHMAPGNRTQTMREVMTIIYYADGATISEPDNPHRPADLTRWFPGQTPGEVAASPLNPLLYHRKQT